MNYEDPKIDELEHDNTGSDESFDLNNPHKDHERDMLGMHKEELDVDFVEEEDDIDADEEEGIENAGYTITDSSEELPVEEGFGLNDAEPDGTGEYDMEDEWN